MGRRRRLAPGLVLLLGYLGGFAPWGAAAECLAACNDEDTVLLQNAVILQSGLRVRQLGTRPVQQADGPSVVADPARAAVSTVVTGLAGALGILSVSVEALADSAAASGKLLDAQLASAADRALGHGEAGFITVATGALDGISDGLSSMMTGLRGVKGAAEASIGAVAGAFESTVSAVDSSVAQQLDSTMRFADGVQHSALVARDAVERLGDGTKELVYASVLRLHTALDDMLQDLDACLLDFQTAMSATAQSAVGGVSSFTQDIRASAPLSEAHRRATLATKRLRVSMRHLAALLKRWSSRLATGD